MTDLVHEGDRFPPSPDVRSRVDPPQFPAGWIFFGLAQSRIFDGGVRRGFFYEGQETLIWSRTISSRPTPASIIAVTTAS